MEDDEKLVYERMIDIASSAKERGVTVAFAYFPKSTTADAERYGAVISNCDNPQLLDALTRPLSNAAPGMVDSDGCGCE